VCPEERPTIEYNARTCHGVVFVYAINARLTFNDVHTIRNQIVQMKKTEDFPCVLVGNKCDLANERQVSAEEGLSLANSWNCSFLETSAKEHINVHECFFDLVRQIGAACSQSRDFNLGPKNNGHNCHLS
jgi:GTPase KRas protein